MPRSKPPAAQPSRGRLKSMRTTDSFRDFVLDQLSDIKDLRPRPMFGGIGLYAGEAFFGILAADVLYLKVDDSNRAQFEAAGAQPFKPFDDGSMSMGYYDVPANVLENAAALVKWARRSIDIAAKPRPRPAKRKR